MMRLMRGEEGEGRFVVSSCHDNSLLALLCSVYGERVFERGTAWPFYADFITFEAWEGESGQKKVRVLYNLDVMQDAFDGEDMISLEGLEHKWADVMIDEETYFNESCVC